jgi:hypothetical protein
MEMVNWFWTPGSEGGGTPPGGGPIGSKNDHFFVTYYGVFDQKCRFHIFFDS